MKGFDERLMHYRIEDELLTFFPLSIEKKTFQFLVLIDFDWLSPASYFKTLDIETTNKLFDVFICICF